MRTLSSYPFPLPSFPMVLADAVPGLYQEKEEEYSVPDFRIFMPAQSSFLFSPSAFFLYNSCKKSKRLDTTTNNNTE